MPLEADNVLSASDLVEAYSADQRAFYPPDLAEELQKLDLLKEEAKLSYLQAIASTQNQSIQALLRMKLADLEIKE